MMSQIGFKRPPSLFFKLFFLSLPHGMWVSSTGSTALVTALPGKSPTPSFITNVTKVIIIGVNIFRAYRGLNNTCDYLVQSAHNPMK